MFLTYFFSFKNMYLTETGGALRTGFAKFRISITVLKKIV